MAEGTGEAGKLGVFISYSRDDLAFADQLDATLRIGGFDTTLDRHGISGGEEWQRRLGNLIRGADTVVFVLTPKSARSDICAWEVKEAVRLGKRIIPVLSGPLDGATPPPELAALNYIHFYPEPKTPGSGFGPGLIELVAALKTDLEWLREHTRLLQRATEWEGGGRPANRLLSGNDIAAAKDWAARRPKEAPAPTALHLDFIKASEAWEASRESAERKRLEEMAAANAERAKALADAQAALAREAAAHEAGTRARRIIQWGSAAAALLILFGVSAFAFQQYRSATTQVELTAEAVRQKGEADRQARLAEASAKQALAARNDALLNQSRLLTSSAVQAIEQGDSATALLLALEAMPDENGEDDISRTRPHWALAEASLYSAVDALRERLILKGHTGTVSAVAVMPDGARIVTASSDNTTRVWDATTGKELLQLKGHTGSIRSLTVTPDGTRVVTGSADGTARVWDAATGKELLQLKGVSGPIGGVAVTSDGARIVTGSGDLFGDGTVQVWDATTGKERLQLKGHTGGVTGAAVTPDGARIVTGSFDNTARVWDAAAGKELLQLKGHTGNVQSVAVTPDGARIVTGSFDNTARVWDAATGKELLQLKGHAGTVQSVAVTPDGDPHRHRLRRQHGSGVGRQHRCRAAPAQGPRWRSQWRRGGAGRGPHCHRLRRRDGAGVGN